MRFQLIAAVATALTAPVFALPNDGLFGRAATACNHDNCLRGLIGKSATASVDCSSYMRTTVTPCASTVTSTSTTTSTTTVTASLPGLAKRAEIPGAGRVEARAACSITTNAPTALPSYAAAACTANPTSPAQRYSSACSCYGVTAQTQTAAATTSTVTVTSTVTATQTAQPPLFILQDSGYQQYYIQIDSTGAAILNSDVTVATPFYIDSQGQPREYHNPTHLFVDRYIPNSNTASDVVFSGVPGGQNLGPLVCQSLGYNAGDFFGSCSVTGSPDGNPYVYGFGNCPNDAPYYLYMIPNDSNVNCYNGGYAFIGFYLVTYTGN